MNITEPRSYFYPGQKVRISKYFKDYYIDTDKIMFVQDLKVFPDGTYGLWVTDIYYETEPIEKHKKNGEYPYYHLGRNYIPVSEND